jgi:hypothetical protein
MVGLTGARSAADESLLEAIFRANPHGGKLQVLDARPKVNAVANTAAGAGYETPKQYPFITPPQFLGLPNIHTARDAYKKLRTLCQRPDDPKWAVNLEATGSISSPHANLHTKPSPRDSTTVGRTLTSWQDGSSGCVSCCSRRPT